MKQIMEPTWEITFLPNLSEMRGIHQTTRACPMKNEVGIILIRHYSSHIKSNLSYQLCSDSLASQSTRHSSFTCSQATFYSQGFHIWFSSRHSYLGSSISVYILLQKILVAFHPMGRTIIASHCNFPNPPVALNISFRVSSGSSSIIV